MDPIQRLREIEHLAIPNKVEPIELPDLMPTEAGSKAATDELTELGISGRSEAFDALFAKVKHQQHQLAQVLNTLAVTKADLNDSHDIIKQWRAHCGYTSNEQGVIEYAAPAIAAA